MLDAEVFTTAAAARTNGIEPITQEQKSYTTPQNRKMTTYDVMDYTAFCSPKQKCLLKHAEIHIKNTHLGKQKCFKIT